MKITYDAEADAGGLVAIEILDARNRIDAIDTIQFHIDGKGSAAPRAAE